MEIIAAFIAIGMPVLLVFAFYYQSSKNKKLKDQATLEQEKGVKSILSGLLANSTTEIYKSYDSYISLIKILYKRNEKKIEIELSNKGFNQLEYIFQNIREEDVKNQRDKANNDKSKLETELRIRKDSDEFNKITSLIRDKLGVRLHNIDILVTNPSPQIAKICSQQYLNEVQLELDEQTDLLLNGDLSEFFNKSSKLRNYQ
ncbi:hypothetical protein HOO14_06180 [bacterium]|jgi:hypothetical protein|nr:hypothetical protein [bacterium]